MKPALLLFGERPVSHQEAEGLVYSYWIFIPIAIFLIMFFLNEKIKEVSVPKGLHRPHQIASLLLKYVYMAVFGLSKFLFGRKLTFEMNLREGCTGVFFILTARILAVFLNLTHFKSTVLAIFLMFWFVLFMAAIFWIDRILDKKADEFRESYEDKKQRQKAFLVLGVFGGTFLCLFSFVFA